MNFPFDPKIILELFPIALTWVCVMMFAFWGLGTVLRNAGLVDLGWVSGLVSLAVIYFVNLDGYLPRQLLMLLMVSVWAGRLFVLLLLRLIKERREDPRYAKMRTGSEAAVHLKLFLMFQFQGVLDLVLSVPFFLVFINPSDKIVGVEWLGFFLWLVAILGETLADDQLRQFKNNPANRGKTCQVGLWYYSRHPNYFFEWLVWVSYFVFALGSPFGWTSIICPALMLYFLIQVTGIPLAEEQSLKNRGEEYRRYQATTSMFVPWFKRKLGPHD